MNSGILHFEHIRHKSEMQRAQSGLGQASDIQILWIGLIHYCTFYYGFRNVQKTIFHRIRWRLVPLSIQSQTVFINNIKVDYEVLQKIY